MLVIPPSKYRRARRPEDRSGVPTTPVLVSAVYVDATSVTLTFDRAVDVSGFDPSTVVVDDPDGTGEQWIGSGGEALTTTVVRVDLGDNGGATTPHVELNVTAGNGIVAATGAARWAGVAALLLPFGV